jgi:hypothetical protein
LNIFSDSAEYSKFSLPPIFPNSSALEAKKKAASKEAGTDKAQEEAEKPGDLNG